MRTLTISRCGLSFIVAAALLTACGSQPIGAPGAMPQAGRAHARPQTSSGALIYSANDVPGSVTTYTYPGGVQVGVASVPGAIHECVDSAGDVFVPSVTGPQDKYTGEIYEFSQGGVVASFPDPHWWIGSCAVNPKTGDLAVSGNASPSNKPGITLYRNGTRKRTILYTSPYYPGFCAYDPAGNLYLGVSYSSSVGLLRLAAGSKTFELMTTDLKITALGTVQWADNHLIVSSQHSDPDEMYLYELSVKGNNATTVRTTRLHTAKYHDHFLGQVWVQGNTVLAHVANGYENGRIGLWAYPRGGLLREKIRVGAYLVTGLVVAPGQ